MYQLYHSISHIMLIPNNLIWFIVFNLPIKSDQLIHIAYIIHHPNKYNIFNILD